MDKVLTEGTGGILHGEGTPDIVVFDIGGVLLDWDPRYLYRQLIHDEDEREQFLSTVCTMAWNEEQDRGRSFDQAVTDLVLVHPDKADLIHAYNTRWPEMISGPILRTVELLEQLDEAGVPIYALTNFNDIKFQLARSLFPFLNRFKGVVVSAEEKLIKPDPAIWKVLFERYELDPARCLYTDDRLDNCQVAASLGMHAVHFTGPAALEKALKQFGLMK
ncbi:HAD family hydrolase [Radicibacter daui]|uniref:HAD family hydrolase n=1 Tax=Radicibacter daui TaxID=3064829 RepID=UPI0040468FEF